MNDDEITWNIITNSKLSNACALFCFVLILYIILTYTKYLMFVELEKTEIIFYESNIFPVLREIFFRKINITSQVVSERVRIARVNVEVLLILIGLYSAGWNVMCIIHAD